MAGSLKFDTWLNDDSTENYKCRAWVNFNGTGTVAIRASGNVSSITDNSTGDYTVNFTNALEDANYTCVESCGSTGLSRFGSPEAFTTVSVDVKCQSSVSVYDPEFMCVTIFR